MIDLEQDKVALVGRSPCAQDVAGLDESSLQVVAIPSPNVSANHVLVEHRGDEVCVRELGSRNGTWLELPPNSKVTLSAPSNLTLHVAPATEHERAVGPPPDVRWSTSDDYENALREGLTEWLDRLGFPSQISVITSTTPWSDHVGRIGLATGRDLVVEPIRTAGPGWLEALTAAERYVSRQNQFFETEESMREDGLVVASEAFRAAVRRVVDIAASGARVLLLMGPSGSGKEGLARCFHRHTQRPGPFVARNCGVFDRELVRSELFGAERGAFTGSVRRIVGAVEAANGGTLFLDELGELPRDVQPMLLRFLDHGEYERIGQSGATSRADVRIVGATSRDLRAATASDAFRPDLWFRLSVHVVEVPSLRQRPEDLAMYLHHATRADGTSIFEALDGEARELLSAHRWPGNFRELVSFAARLKVACPSGAIATRMVRSALAEGSLASPPVAAYSAVDGTDVAAHAQRALTTFLKERAALTSWDDVKDYLENYLKPVMFAELGGAANLPAFDDVNVREIAARLGSDRGTATKQLRRYFERLAGP